MVTVVEGGCGVGGGLVRPHCTLQFLGGTWRWHARPAYSCLCACMDIHPHSFPALRPARRQLYN